MKLLLWAVLIGGALIVGGWAVWSAHNQTTLTNQGLEQIRLVADIFVAVGTVALAIATGILAWKTKVLASEGATAQAQAERQHRQQLMPLLRTIEGAGTVRVQQILSVDDHEGKDRTIYNASSQLINKGAGPALNTRLFLEIVPGRIERFKSRNTGDDVPIPPLGAGDSVTISDWDLYVLRDIAFSGEVARQPVTLIIEYDDIFDQTFQTIYEGKKVVRFKALKSQTAER